MANPYYSDVSPEYNPKNSNKDAEANTRGKGRKTLPMSDPTWNSPKSPTGSQTQGKERVPSGKGGKMLPCPKFEEYGSRCNETSGELPKNT